MLGDLTHSHDTGRNKHMGGRHADLKCINIYIYMH